MITHLNTIYNARILLCAFIIVTTISNTIIVPPTVYIHLALVIVPPAVHIHLALVIVPPTVHIHLALVTVTPTIRSPVAPRTDPPKDRATKVVTPKPTTLIETDEIIITGMIKHGARQTLITMTAKYRSRQTQSGQPSTYYVVGGRTNVCSQRHRTIFQLPKYIFICMFRTVSVYVRQREHKPI